MLNNDMDHPLPFTTSSYTEIYRQKTTSSKDMETTTKKKIFGEIEEIDDEVERRFDRFKNFDIIRHYPYDHYYSNYMSHDAKKITPWSSFQRRIEQEWEFLKEDIPSSIFIRVYEQRNNLTRAAIVGPPGTPYHHCLFFFDIIYPRDYPSSPPKIHYLSDGIDLNPNLKPGGRICFDSLKQNWPENNNKYEFDPNGVHILYFLQEVQNVIFSTKPTNSMMNSHLTLYTKSEQMIHNDNNRFFVLTCEKMMRILRRPPVDFEYFVPGFYRHRAHWILLKFKENNYDSDDMIKLFVALFKVFERNGAYCMHHLDFVRSQKQKSKAEIEAIIRNLKEHQWEYEAEMLKSNYDSLKLNPFFR